LPSEIVKNTQTDISSREKEILEERLTENPAALNYYLQGLQHLAISGQMGTYKNWDESIKEAFKAKEKLRKAIMLDSGFIAAYVKLVLIYIDNLHHITNDKDLKYAYLDSGLVLTETTLSLYEQIPKDRNYRQSLLFKSIYYYYKGDLEKSKIIAEKANEIPVPKDEGYYVSGTYVSNRYDNYYGCIENFLDYIEIIQENTIIYPQLYRVFYKSLYFTGFPEVADFYVKKSLATTEDTLFSYWDLCRGHFHIGNYHDCIKYGNKGLAKDSSIYHYVYYIMNSYIILNDYANAVKCARILEKYDEELICGNSHTITKKYLNSCTKNG
jgi:hypothetical protein